MGASAAADACFLCSNLEFQPRVADAVQVQQRVGPFKHSLARTDFGCLRPAVLCGDTRQVRHGEHRQLRDGPADAGEHVRGDLQLVQLPDCTVVQSYLALRSHTMSCSGTVSLSSSWR